jgi:hypothetical protein
MRKEKKVYFAIKTESQSMAGFIYIQVDKAKCQEPKNKKWPTKPIMRKRGLHKSKGRQKTQIFYSLQMPRAYKS